MRPGFAGPAESVIQAMLHQPARASVRKEGPRGKPGFPPRLQSAHRDITSPASVGATITVTFLGQRGIDRPALGFSYLLASGPHGFEGYLPFVDAVVNPDGKFVVEPLHERQEIVYAEIVPSLLRGPRFQLDVAGHYGRPDVFQLTVDRGGPPIIR